MSSSDAALIQPPVHHSTFDALRVGRSSQFIVARLLRFWDSKNINNPSQFMGLTLLLLDEKDAMINAFIPASRTIHYRPSLREGNIIKVKEFDVERCPYMYKMTEHTLVIRFSNQTTIDEVLKNGPVINLQKFMVRQYDHLEILANTNLELPDVVGQIQSVKGCSLEDVKVMTPLVVSFLIAPMVAIYLSLWDEAAAMFRDLLNSADRTHTVMVVTNINPQNIGGTLFLKSSPTTRFFTDTNLPTITEFTARLISAQEEPLPCFHMKKKLTDKQPVSIGELNKFITNSNQQEAYFICKAQIVEVLQENGWSYVSCIGCSRKLQRSGPSLHCTQCVNPDVTGVVKYRLELLVYDGNDIATFVVFDKDILKLTRQDAADLLLYEVHGGGCQQLPQGLSELAGKEFVFHIHVTPYNFTSLHRTFTVSEISDDIKPKSSITNEAKFQGEKGDEATASGSTSYMDAVGEEGVDKRPHQ